MIIVHTLKSILSHGCYAESNDDLLKIIKIQKTNILASELHIEITSNYFYPIKFVVVSDLDANTLVMALVTRGILQRL